MNNDGFSFKSKFSWQIFSTVIFVGISFIQSIVIATNIGIKEFGIFSMLVAISTIVSQLLDPRYLDFLIRYLTKLYNKKDYLISNQVIMLALGSSLCVLLISVMGVSIFSESLVKLIFNDYINLSCMLALTLISTLISTHFFTIFQAILRTKEMVKELSIINIIVYFLRFVVVAIVLIYFDYGLYGIVASLALINILLLIFQFLYIVKVINKDSDFNQYSVVDRHFFAYKMQGSFKFIKGLYLNSIISIPQKELDITMLGFFVIPESVGLYRMAKNFIVAIWALVDAVVLIIFPEIAKLIEKDSLYSVYKIIIKNIVVGILVSIVIFITLWLSLPLLLTLLLTPEYKGVYELTLIMLAGSILWMPLIWVYPLALSIDKIKTIVISTFLTGAFAIIAYYIFIPWMGVNGASLVYTIVPGISSAILLLGLIKTSEFRKIFERPNAAS